MAGLWWLIRPRKLRRGQVSSFPETLGSWSGSAEICSSPGGSEQPTASPSEKTRDYLSQNPSDSRETGGAGGKVVEKFVVRSCRWRLEVEVGIRDLGGEVLKLIEVSNLHRKYSFRRYLSRLKLGVILVRVRV
jgi:hypothetical protein